jgi:O-antigen ligase
MKINLLKIKGKVKMNHSGESAGYIDLDTILTRLKKEDARLSRNMKNFTWLYTVLIIVYLCLLVFNPDSDLVLQDRITGLLYAIAFLYFAIAFRKYWTNFRQIDYSLPVVVTFEKAVKRYDFSLKRLLVALPPILFIDAGVTLSEYPRLLSMEPMNRILTVQAFFIPLIIVSSLIGYFIWRKKHKPLRDSARQLLKEMVDA